ncbi:Hypothetical predicted protein [Marmota monax]|uniref:Ig-like domain-containing protein n=1 Tax=Marmota monax TaxID=9995 RepID=A0A5E4AQS4_MARMO|nr:hypothetical protein GHT09_000231 [Marmota monax]VTJ59525.1 Hypothetical predicted protein [Marmota monax]
MVVAYILPNLVTCTEQNRDPWILPGDDVTEKLQLVSERVSEKASRLCSFPDTMCTIRTCFMVLCLLSAGSLGQEVTQTPRHLIKGKGQRVKMFCVPIKGHNYLFWYQQILAKQFKFLVSFQFNKVSDQSGMPKERFSAECSQNSSCSLEIQPTELQDSATYLCASSEPTL